VITEQILPVVNSKKIIMWNIYPEERRWWRENEMRYLRVIYETIKKLDPYDRPVWMYEPCHRDSESMIKTLEYQDVCGKGMYVNHTGMKDTRVWAKWSMEQQLRAIKNKQRNIVSLVVPEMYCDAEPKEKHLIRKWCRHDVYTGLVKGGQGVIIWSGYRHRRGFEKHFQEYYDGYSSVAKDLNGSLELGKVFLFGQKRNDLNVQVIKGPESLAVEYGDSKKIIYKYSSISFLDIAYNTERYLFIINSSNDNVRVRIDGLPDEDVLCGDVFNCQKTMENVKQKFDVTMNPLEVKAYKFKPLKNDHI